VCRSLTGDEARDDPRTKVGWIVGERVRNKLRLGNTKRGIAIVFTWAKSKGPRT